MEGYKSTSLLSDIIRHSPDLHQLIAAAENIKQLNKAVLDFYGPEYKPHVKVAKLDNSILILASQDQSWNHKVRFMSYDLLSELRKNPRWRAIKSVKCLVKLNFFNNISYSTNEFTKEKIAELMARYESFPKPTPPSSTTAEHILQHSSYIKHAQLAMSLKKLAGMFVKT